MKQLSDYSLNGDNLITLNPEWPTMMEKKSYCGAYLIYHYKTGKFYVGHSKCLYSRKYQHLSRLKSNTHSNKDLQEAYLDDSNISFTVIQFTINEDEAINVEQHLLDFYFNTGLLFNKEPNARNSIGSIRDNESKRNISIGNRKIWQRSGHRELKSKLMKDFYSNPINKAKVFNAQRKAVQNPDYRKSQAEKANKQWADPQARLNKAKQVAEYALKNGKKVLINNKVYPHIAEASRQLNIHISTLTARIKSNNSKWCNYSFL